MSDPVLSVSDRDRMTIMICVGGGSFGTQAALQGRTQGDRVLVIDIDANCRARSHADSIIDDLRTFQGSPPGSIHLLVDDGTRALLNILQRWVPDRVVAASRGHLAAHLAAEHVRGLGKSLRPMTEILPTIIKALPPGSVMVSDLQQAVVVTSYMPSSLLCDDGCMQPSICPVTGLDIPIPMHEAIFRAVEDMVDLPIVLQTTRTEDVASISGKELAAMLSSLEQLEDGSTCAIATVCACHGFLNLFHLNESK